MRTGNIDVQTLLAQAQARLASEARQAQAPSTGTPSDTERIGKLAPALAGAHERIAAQAHAASASLSALGRFKSDLFDLGTAAKALSSLSATSGSKAVQSALDKLVAAYNAAQKNGAAVDGQGTDRAQRELRASADGLGALGAVRQPDGSLALDTGVLGKALADHPAGTAAALAGAAERIATVTSAALAQGSRLSSSLSRLDGQAQALKAQQAAVMDAATRIAGLNGAASHWSALALAAYRSS